MRTIQQAIDQVKTLTYNNKHIRALIFQGSLIMPHPKIDAFTDIDPLFIVDDLNMFINDESWIELFGTPIARFNDKIDISQGGECYTRLMIMDDHFKIDASFMHVKDARFANNFLLYKIIIDKDNVVPKPSFNDASAFYVNKPSQETYVKTIQTFFFDTSYVIKSLRRGEFFFTRHMYHVLNQKLKKLLSWYVGIFNDFNINIGSEGRYLFDMLDKKTRAMLLETFAGKTMDDNFKALDAYVNLVGHLGRTIEKHLGYPYPYQTEKDMIRYIEEATCRPLETQPDISL